MHRLLPLFVTLSGCTSGELLIAGIRPVDMTCAVAETSTVGASLDLGGLDESLDQRYFELRAPLIKVPNYFVQIDFGPVASNQRVVLEKAQLSYAYTDSPGAKARPLKSDTIDIFHSVPPKPEDGTPFVMSLLGPLGSEDLVNRTGISEEKDIDPSTSGTLIVSVEVLGRFGASGAVVSSGPVAFPITISRTPQAVHSCFSGSSPEACFNPGQNLRRACP